MGQVQTVSMEIHIVGAQHDQCQMMVISPSDDNTAFRARSALVSGAAAGRTEFSERQDFEDASLVQIDDVLNQVYSFQILNQSEKK